MTIARLTFVADMLISSASQFDIAMLLIENKLKVYHVLIAIYRHYFEYITLSALQKYLHKIIAIHSHLHSMASFAFS